MAALLLPLSMASQGAVTVIESVGTGRGMRRRLADMGLIPGVKLRVVQNHMPGPVCVEARGTKFCLGHGLAHKILVNSDENESYSEHARIKKGYGWKRR